MPMASLSTCHLGLWLGWQILLNLVIKKQIQLQERYEKLVGTEYEEYNRQRNKNNGIRKKAQREYEKKLLKRIKYKPQLFYSDVRSKLKVKPVIPHLRKEDGETITNDQEIADVLGKFFEPVFTTEDNGDNILPEF